MDKKKRRTKAARRRKVRGWKGVQSGPKSRPVQKKNQTDCAPQGNPLVQQKKLFWKEKKFWGLPSKEKGQWKKKKNAFSTGFFPYGELGKRTD